MREVVTGDSLANGERAESRGLSQNSASSIVAALPCAAHHRSLVMWVSTRRLRGTASEEPFGPRSVAGPHSRAAPVNPRPGPGAAGRAGGSVVPTLETDRSEAAFDRLDLPAVAATRMESGIRYEVIVKPRQNVEVSHILGCWQQPRHFRSKINAAPCPPPTQRAERPISRLRRCISLRSVKTSRAPVAPTG